MKYVDFDKYCLSKSFGIKEHVREDKSVRVPGMTSEMKIIFNELLATYDIESNDLALKVHNILLRT
jgi:hypothetical protein